MISYSVAWKRRQRWWWWASNGVRAAFIEHLKCCILGATNMYCDLLPPHRQWPLWYGLWRASTRIWVRWSTARWWWWWCLARVWPAAIPSAVPTAVRWNDGSATPSAADYAHATAAPATAAPAAAAHGWSPTAGYLWGTGSTAAAAAAAATAIWYGEG